MAASFPLTALPLTADGAEAHRFPPARPQLVVLPGGHGTAARRPPVRPTHAVYVVRRLFAATVAVALVLGVLSVLSWATGPSADGPVPATYQVGAHDTLWSIAGRLGVDADRRWVVEQLADANGGAQVRPGQRLVVPESLVELGR